MACSAMTATTAVVALAPVVAKVPTHKGLAVAVPLTKKQAALAISNGSRVSMRFVAEPTSLLLVHSTFPISAYLG